MIEQCRLLERRQERVCDARRPVDRIKRHTTRETDTLKVGSKVLSRGGRWIVQHHAEAIEEEARQGRVVEMSKIRATLGRRNGLGISSRKNDMRRRAIR